MSDTAGFYSAFQVKFTGGPEPVTWNLDLDGVARLLEDIRRADQRYGRPPGTRFFRDAEDLEAKLIPLIQQLDKRHKPSTQSYLAELLDISEDTIRRACRDYQRPLDAIRRKARQPLSL